MKVLIRGLIGWLIVFLISWIIGYFGQVDQGAVFFWAYIALSILTVLVGAASSKIMSVVAADGKTNMMGTIERQKVKAVASFASEAFRCAAVSMVVRVVVLCIIATVVSRLAEIEFEIIFQIMTLGRCISVNIAPTSK